jgi:hypothetical protein
VVDSKQVNNNNHESRYPNCELWSKSKSSEAGFIEFLRMNLLIEISASGFSACSTLACEHLLVLIICKIKKEVF